MNAKTKQKIRDVIAGKAPTLKEALAKVIGNKTLHLDQIISGLKKRGLAPNSKNPRAYVGQTLARHDEFEHVGDSNYRVKSMKKTTPKGKKKSNDLLSVLLPGLRKRVGAAAEAEGKTITDFVSEVVVARLETTPPAPGALRFTFDVDPSHVRGLKALAYIEGRNEHEIIAEVLRIADRALSHLINTTVESLKVPDPTQEAPTRRRKKSEGHTGRGLTWEPEHDKILLELVAATTPRKHGSRTMYGWPDIAERFSARIGRKMTGQACFTRWTRIQKKPVSKANGVPINTVLRNAGLETASN